MLLAVRVPIGASAVTPLAPGNAFSGLCTMEAGEITVQIDAGWSVTRSASAEGQVEAPHSGELTVLKAGEVSNVPGDVGDCAVPETSRRSG